MPRKKLLSVHVMSRHIAFVKTVCKRNLDLKV